jgi:diguanylate cyclase
MTAYDPSFARRKGVFRSWFGLGRQADDNEPEGAVAPSLGSAGRPDHRDSVRTRQLQEVGRFLSHHGLEVTSNTLAIAYGYLNDTDSQIAQLINRQIQARNPVTMEWLDEVLAKPEREDEVATMVKLMERLETSIEDFGKTSKEARTATSEYSTALEAHVDELEQVSKAGVVISELAAIAKVMLKRTRMIEKQMVRNDAQTRNLRHRLDEARRTAEEDHLTGLPNRRAFEAHFEQEYREARASTQTLAVAFCDIDHFKLVNDTHGHDAGDRVIRLVAQSLARISNDHCHVARHGGEEFVVLFRNVALPDAVASLDRLRQEMAERRLVNRANDLPFGQVTFSGGIADVFAFSDRRAALRAADAALYRAKREGRNRISIADLSDVEGLAA